VGLKFDPHYSSSSAVLEALGPLLQRWRDESKERFKILAQDSFSVQLTTDPGFAYGIDPERVWVDFRHSMKAKAVSGGPPVLEMISHPLPFTQLLPEVTRRLTEIIWLLPGANKRTLRRIGVIASTAVDPADVPPGIGLFMKYIARPWENVNLDSFHFQIAGDIGDGAGWKDRCIHFLTKPEDPDQQLLSVKLDWQRTFDTPRPVTAASLNTLLGDAQKDALEYFEDVAQGNRFDEELLSRTAARV
jgi:hypothetical protein